LLRPDSVGFKPPATISQEQSTARYDGSSGVLAAKGRHDPCVVPRAVPIVETMSALVIMEYVPFSERSPHKLYIHEARPKLMSRSMLLQQNARRAAAALLPALTHLPPTMVLPGNATVLAVANGNPGGEAVQDQKPGDE
jgi:chorismate synthase